MKTPIRVGARLRAARKAAGFKTSRDFLSKHKIAASTYSQHESGARLPDDESLKFYCDTFEVNFEWMKTGSGKPYSLNNSKKNLVISEELIDLNKTKTKHIINQKLLTIAIEKSLVALNFNASKKIAKQIAKFYDNLINDRS